MKKKLLVLALSAVTIFSMFGCAATPKNATIKTQTMESQETTKINNTSEKKFSIVATTFAPYDWIRHIVGENNESISLTLLQDTGVDLHSFQPTAEDMIQIAECDMFVYIGGESDEWVEAALQNGQNENRVVVNLLDVLGDKAKEEETVEGMESDHDHDHGSSTFDDSDVADRTLADWAGEWQSVYPFLLDGTLDEAMEHMAEEDETGKTAEEYYEYYKTGYATDIEDIVIEGNTISFIQNGISSKASYDYKGYEILTYESGSKGVRYQFEAIDVTNGAPKFVQFSDHGIEPAKAEHFHIYMGNESFEELSQEMDHWPTYYPKEWSKEQIADSFIDHSHDEELDEHVWLSLKNADIYCEYLAAQIETMDPDHTSIYVDNLQNYIGELKKLDAEYTATVDEASVKTLLFGDRFPFRYLVDDYGLQYYAAFSGCSAETEASFETVAFLAEKVDELQLKYIITIDGGNTSIAETIVKATKSKDQQILKLDSMQSVTKLDVDNGNTYLSMMEQNLQILKEALS